MSELTNQTETQNSHMPNVPKAPGIGQDTWEWEKLQSESPKIPMKENWTVGGLKATWPLLQ